MSFFYRTQEESIEQNVHASLLKNIILNVLVVYFSSALVLKVKKNCTLYSIIKYYNISIILIIRIL